MNMGLFLVIAVVFRQLLLVDIASLVALDELRGVDGGELVYLVVVADNDDGKVDLAKHGQLVGLFEKTGLPLDESDGSVAVVRQGLDCDFSSTHCVG